MKVIQPSYEILNADELTNATKFIEKVARTCYKSEGSIGENTDIGFCKGLISRKHFAMVEFKDIVVRFVHNRGFTHELVRHRLASFAQESTRYCNYFQEKFGNELTFIEPYWFSFSHYGQEEWFTVMETIEDTYLKLVDSNCCKLPAQAARGVLPNDIKTEIVIKANIREWRTIFGLRTDKPAHPDMHRVMIPLLDDLKKLVPVLFDDIIFS